jgi:dTDP-glucose 4,6-dehydratase
VAAQTLITHVTDRPGHDRRYAINAAKMQSELGFVPSYTFEQGIQETIQWFLTHDTWWRAIQDGSYRGS